MKKPLKPYHTDKPKAKKYVAFNDGSVVTFPKSQVHALVAKSIGKKPVSAGFFYPTKTGVRVIGHSDSLQLKPKAGDASKIIKKIKK